MTIWNSYPPTYRSAETNAVLSAVRAGECAAMLGLSGSGKSNLLGFLANRMLTGGSNPSGVLVDCNRLDEATPAGFYRLVETALGAKSAEDHLASLETAIQERLAGERDCLCILFDRFDALPVHSTAAISGGLRALRDQHKYALTYVIAARQPLDPQIELAELFFANTLWLGPLAEADAAWSISRYATRRGLEWDTAVIEKLILASGGYPAWLRAACEAFAAGAELDPKALGQHPAVRQRLAEFWAAAPSAESIANSRLAGIPLLNSGTGATSAQDLTAKEQLLMAYFQAHSDQVCEKDDLIRAVWPEDRVFSRGVRDDSLAQLVRRLREKVEPDPSRPRHILTSPGRGYRYH